MNRDLITGLLVFVFFGLLSGMVVSFRWACMKSDEAEGYHRLSTKRRMTDERPRDQHYPTDRKTPL